MTWRDRQLAGAVAICLLALYLFTFSGNFHSSDGFSMYAAADSIVRYGRLDTEQIRWMGWQQGSFGPDGLLYSRKGLATPLLAMPLVWLGLHVPDVGPVHTTLLLTPIVSALTGAYLYLAARRGFSGMTLPIPWAPLGVALTWGLGSMAWPYAKTFFSEPVVALTIAGATYHLIAFRDTLNWRHAAWIGFWMGLGLLARLANAIVIPGFTLALFAYLTRAYWVTLPDLPPGTPIQTAVRSYGRSAWAWWQRYRWQPEVWATVVAFGVPMVLAGLVYLGYNVVRFGNPFESGYLPSETFSANPFVGVAGQLLSPGRGLLWYTPWLLLLPLGVWRGWRHDRVLVALCLSIVASYVLFYGKWYMWHGGFAWGSRFLVPMLPALALLAMPLFRADGGTLASALRLPWEWAQRIPVRDAFVWLALLGGGVNLIGVVWDFMPQQQALDAAGFPLFHPTTFFHPRWAQIPGVLALGFGKPLDLIWVVDGQVNGRMLAMGLGIATIGLVIMVGALLERQGTWVSAGIALLAALTWLLLGDARAFQRADYHTIVEAIGSTALPGATIWHDDIEQAATFLNVYRGTLPIYGLATGGSDLPEEAAERAPVLAQAPHPVWFISDGPERPANGLDLLLLPRKALVSDEPIALAEGVAPLRLALYYDAPERTPVVTERDWALPGEEGAARPSAGRGGATRATGPLMRLDHYRLTGSFQPGGVIGLELNWEALRPIPEDFQVFVHLVRADDPSVRVAQHDGAPVNGLRPTSSWQADETIRDPHALRLAPTLPPGTYQLRVGLYRLSDGARLVSPEGGDTLEIGPLEVQPTTDGGASR